MKDEFDRIYDKLDSQGASRIQAVAWTVTFVVLLFGLLFNEVTTLNKELADHYTHSATYTEKILSHAERIVELEKRCKEQ